MLHVLNGETVINGVGERAVQPNAVDLSVCRVFKMEGDCKLLGDNTKIHRSHVCIEPQDGVYVLEPGVYEVQLNETIEVGENECGYVIVRSTLSRNGITLSSGLYDSGYKGPMSVLMTVTCGKLTIEKGTRIGQYLNFHCKSVKLYNGSYGFGKSDLANKLYE